jgi:hypothetical protein
MQSVPHAQTEAVTRRDWSGLRCSHACLSEYIVFHEEEKNEEKEYRPSIERERERESSQHRVVISLLLATFALEAESTKGLYLPLGCLAPAA